jgi:hypothetical protein
MYDKQIYKYTVSTEANFSKGCLMISISRYSIYAIVNSEGSKIPPVPDRIMMHIADCVTCDTKAYFPPNPCEGSSSAFVQCISKVADPGSGAFLTPGSGMGKNQDPDPG